MEALELVESEFTTPSPCSSRGTTRCTNTISSPAPAAVKGNTDALPSIHNPLEDSRQGPDGHLDDPPQHDENAQSSNEYPPLEDILTGKGSNTSPRSPRASTFEEEDPRPPSPHLSPCHSAANCGYFEPVSDDFDCPALSVGVSRL